MGGEIKVVKKDGPGTLMRLFLLLNTPPDPHGIVQHCQFKFEQHKLTVLLALNGSMGRLIISQWLQKNGVNTCEASEWNELTQILQENFQCKSYIHTSPSEISESEELDIRGSSFSVFIIFIDIRLLDLRTDIWKEQLSYLDEYFGRAKFAWILNHDTSNTIKSELRQRGHLLMINRPIYKAKIIQIFEAVIKDQNLELQNYMNTLKATAIEGELNERLEIDVIPSCAASSDDSDKSEHENSSSVSQFQAGEKTYEKFQAASPCRNGTLNNYFVEFPQANFEEDTCNMKNPGQKGPRERHRSSSTCAKNRDTPSNGTFGNEQNSLEGLHILLAEDTPVLQRVATIMLEKLGAKVVAVSDGLQAVDALKFMLDSNQSNLESPKEDVNTTSLPYHLILMDCQMPKMDGYEATKAIRKSEVGTGLHIPIVALTAHAMSSDEAKCLEVGMDAYLTKPIDRKLMVSTILSLTGRTAQH